VNAKQLERFLVHLGANASAIDVVTRRLRAGFNLKTRGRGLNARDLTTAEVSWIVAAYAGADIAAKADVALTRLKQLSGVGETFKHSGDFLMSLELILADQKLAYQVSEVRVCRNLPMAEIHYKDGTKEKFVPASDSVTGASFGNSSYRSEGVLGAGLIQQLAIELSGVND
jgi:hypothetical protein